MRRSPPTTNPDSTAGVSTTASGRPWSLAAAVVIMVAAALVYSHGLGASMLDDDEDGYFYAAWRIAEGEVPYRDFLTPQLPGFMYGGAAVVATVGPNPRALRAWSLVLVLVAGAGVYAAGRELAGDTAGLAAMAIFLFREDVFLIGRAFRPEALLLAATTAGLLVFLVADRRQSARGMAAAGLLFALGLVSKLFAALPWAATVAFIAAGIATGRRP
ncbi:MAG: ArnT family glycosyltransferase, partial [Anaerolineae bacterium]